MNRASGVYYTTQATLLPPLSSALTPRSVDSDPGISIAKFRIPNVEVRSDWIDWLSEYISGKEENPEAPKILKSLLDPLMEGDAEQTQKALSTLLNHFSYFLSPSTVPEKDMEVQRLAAMNQLEERRYYSSLESHITTVSVSPASCVVGSRTRTRGDSEMSEIGALHVLHARYSWLPGVCILQHLAPSRLSSYTRCPHRASAVEYGHISFVFPLPHSSYLRSASYLSCSSYVRVPRFTVFHPLVAI